MHFQNTQHYQHGNISTSAVVLINLGTPAAPTTTATRRYLRRFLSDSRVIEIPRFIWYPILYLLVLTLRPGRVAKLYQKIWHREGSPLLVHTLEQAKQLSAKLAANGMHGVIVKAAMCYSEPDIRQTFAGLQSANVKKLLVLPMYPQYSATTTAATFDLVTRELQRYRWLPELRFVHHYHDNSGYINACTERIKQFFQQQGKPTKLIFSFHGLPKANLFKGDPYHCYCHTTARLIAEQLNLAPDEWALCFQSRFGRAEWLQPYIDKTLRQLPLQNVKNIAVFCPGFAADCLETLEEIAIQNRDLFLNAGGETFHYIPALNDSDPHIDALVSLVKQHTANWGFGDDPALTAEQRKQTRQRALDKGAEQ